MAVSQPTFPSPGCHVQGMSTSSFAKQRLVVETKCVPIVRELSRLITKETITNLYRNKRQLHTVRCSRIYWRTHLSLPGHNWLLQLDDWWFDPWHSRPPFVGAGLEQVRFLILLPPPQVLEHFVQLLQELHSPLTWKKTNEKSDHYCEM